MLKRAILPGAVLLGLGVCPGFAASPVARPAQSEAARVTSVKLTVAVDRSSNCKLSLSATIDGGKGKVWYRFEGPPGVTFDFGPEDTVELDISTWAGVGKGATMDHDIAGQFRVQAAMVEPNGKHGPVTFSNSVPANYTCGGGSSVASPVTVPGSGTESRGAGNRPLPSRNFPAPPQRTMTGSAAPGGAAGISKVTAVALKGLPPTYNGPCQSNQAISAVITTDGPGTVWYRIYANVGGMVFPDGQDGTVTFTEAGSQTVTKRITIIRHHKGQFLIQAAMQGPTGRHGPVTISAPVEFDYNCSGEYWAER